MQCLFAKGKEGETTLSGNISAGSFVLPIEQANLYFQPGDLCFVTDADGSHAEFRGPVAAVSANEIQCVHAASRNRSQGAPCFKPQYFYWWLRNRSYPVRRILDSGIEQRRSAGGVLYLTKIREASFSETVAFDNLRKKQIDDFVSFLDTILSGGVEHFTFCDEEGAVITAALLSSRITRKDQSPQTISIEMELLEIAPSRYV
ncbi:hypothetical protein JW926_00670 [Candidatus Sumerlaeota bacterium]|nr:hypothetical protein [Candidatus Sumerlaeota bacterium]